MAEKTKDGLKLDYKKTILTGFGFLATSIAWAIYDPYITKILNKILSENTGKPLEVIERDTERDNFMSAAEAAEYGLIDKVITKR